MSDVRSPENVRVAARFQVTYKTLDELIVAYSTNLSRGGMFLATDSLVERDAIVLVKIELPESASPIEVHARVVYARDSDSAAATGLPAGLGLQFVDLSPDVLVWLESFITDRTNAESDTAKHAALRVPLNIVIVEDDPVYAREGTETFRSRGDRVRVAKDGLEALGLCLSDQPDVVISDLNMPRMDGWQLLRLLRARPQFARTPVLFSTRLSGEKERLRGYEMGVDDYIAKPYSGAELRARVDRLIARRESPSSIVVSPADVVDVRALRGDLTDVSLHSVLSFLEMEQRSGELIVRGPTLGKIWLRNGRPARAETLPMPEGGPSAAVYRLLDVCEGEFEFRSVEVPGTEEIGLSLSQMMIEHARLRDESGRDDTIRITLNGDEF